MNTIPTWLLAVGAVLGLGMAFMPWEAFEKRKPSLDRTVVKLYGWLEALHTLPVSLRRGGGSARIRSAASSGI